MNNIYYLRWEKGSDRKDVYDYPQTCRGCLYTHSTVNAVLCPRFNERDLLNGQVMYKDANGGFSSISKGS